MLINPWMGHTPFLLTFTPQMVAACNDATKLCAKSSSVFNTFVSYVLLKGVLSHGARTVRAFSGVSGDFTQWRGPQQTTLVGVPKCLCMVTKGLWVISSVSFCRAGLFLLLPGGSNGFHTSKCT